MHSKFQSQCTSPGKSCSKTATESIDIPLGLASTSTMPGNGFTSIHCTQSWEQQRLTNVPHGQFVTANWTNRTEHRIHISDVSPEETRFPYSPATSVSVTFIYSPPIILAQTVYSARTQRNCTLPAFFVVVGFSFIYQELSDYNYNLRIS